MSNKFANYVGTSLVAQDGMVPFFELAEQLKKKQKKWKSVDKKFSVGIDDARSKENKAGLGGRNFVTKAVEWSDGALFEKF
jgi:hypothetical protein